MLGQVGVIEIETPMGKGAGPEGGLRTVIKRCQKVFATRHTGQQPPYSWISPAPD